MLTSTPPSHSPPAVRSRPLPACCVSTFISFSATTGVEYTLKALIVVIMAGVGRVTGTLAAGLLLGVVELLGGYLLDPALTIAINFSLFMLVLLLRPTGLFTRA